MNIKDMLGGFVKKEIFTENEMANYLFPQGLTTWEACMEKLNALSYCSDDFKELTSADPSKGTSAKPGSGWKIENGEVTSFLDEKSKAELIDFLETLNMLMYINLPRTLNSSFVAAADLEKKPYSGPGGKIYYARPIADVCREAENTARYRLENIRKSNNEILKKVLSYGVGSSQLLSSFLKTGILPNGYNPQELLIEFENVFAGDAYKAEKNALALAKPVYLSEENLDALTIATLRTQP